MNATPLAQTALAYRVLPCVGFQFSKGSSMGSTVLSSVCVVLIGLSPLIIIGIAMLAQ